MYDDENARARAEEIRRGGAKKYHAGNEAKGKLFCRQRIDLLCDAGSFIEDGLFANGLESDLPADAVVTGLGRIDGRRVAVMASDSTVKAGSWGARSVEKILRLQENAARHGIPLFYLMDSAGARITDQVEVFPGRRGAGRIFFNQVQLSGQVPQICILFGPSAAGGAYVPAFCDVVFMVKGNAVMFLGSPRMVETAIGETVSMEEMGGAEMHASVSGCADFLCSDEKGAIEAARSYFRFFPQSFKDRPRSIAPTPPPSDNREIEEIIPKEPNKPFDVREVIRALADDSSFMEVKERYARELVTGLARIDGRAVGVVANQPSFKGGVLFVDSADKAARFIWLCDAFNIPLIFLADVPGFMVGSKVERQGIIRAGAKMIAAVSDATVPKISVVLRKAYGAGLYAMSGPAFETDATLALPGAMIAVMSPEAAVNAVYFNKIEKLEQNEREAFVQEKIEAYARDVDIMRLASDLVVDAIVPTRELRLELTRRLAMYENKMGRSSQKKRTVYPV